MGSPPELDVFFIENPSFFSGWWLGVTLWLRKPLNGWRYLCPYNSTARGVQMVDAWLWDSASSWLSYLNRKSFIPREKASEASLLRYVRIEYDRMWMTGGLARCRTGPLLKQRFESGVISIRGRTFDQIYASKWTLTMLTPGLTTSARIKPGNDQLVFSMV